MIPIKWCAQKYHWGRVGLESYVGQYEHKNGGTVEGEHFAELWMGTHPKSHSLVHIDDEIKHLLNPEYFEQNKDKTVELEEVINAHQDSFVNQKLVNMEKVPGSGSLPFLFKILSVDTSLSIQAHPHKELARQLHQDFPDIYKDANHKPEMIIALTDFEALCSFSKSNVIFDRITSNNSLAEFYWDINLEGLKEDNSTKETLQSIIKVTFDADQEKVTHCVQALVADITNIVECDRTEHQSLALRLNTQYENDVGIIVSFLLNYKVLKPGEALCLKPNEPHAYLHGEGIECMATSDNVVRGGLTPKLKDAKVLVSMLTYETGDITPLHGDRNKEAEHSEINYISGFEEFNVVKLSCNSDTQVSFIDIYYIKENEESKSSSSITYTLEDPGILIWMAGKGKAQTGDGKDILIEKFDTFYCLPNTNLYFEPTNDESFEVYIATLGNS